MDAMSIGNKEILKNSSPIAFTYITLGITFGALFSIKGGSTFEALIIATFCFAGAAQFVALEFYNSGFSFIFLFTTIFILNIRHIIYGLSFLNMWKGWRKFYLFSALTDENFGISQIYKSKEPSDNEWLKIFSINHLYWILGCVFGSLIPESTLKSFEGSDFALTALFVAIFTSSLKSRKVSNE
jgi:4-azaleucine resistance transporter AzlC